MALGAYLPKFQLNPEDALAHYIELAGRPPAVLHWFQNWSPDEEFPAEPLRRAHAAGSSPMISWAPMHSLQPIAVGEHDSYIRSYAAAAAAAADPLLLRFAHEMNLRGIPWYGDPPTYRAAWARVHSIFREMGAANVRFVWSPYVVDRNADDFEPYFPGTDRVDWLALDGYNWGRQRWRNRWASFDKIFAHSYAAIRRLAPHAPLMLAEIGCAARGGDKAAWMRDALLTQIPDRYPAISAVVWFNRNRPDHADWRIDSSPEALAVWRAAAADPRYVLSGAELSRDSRPSG